MINLSNENLYPISSLSRFWGYVLIFFTVIISPFYFYSSGLPQPGHIIMLLAAATLIFLNGLACINLIRRNLIGVLFLSLVAVINIIYASIYFDSEFILSTVYWLYGASILLAVMIIAQNQSIILWTHRLILVKLGLVVLAYLIGLGSYTWWPRYEYFFNGPNQLAYFAICLLLVYLAVGDGRIKVGLYLVYIFAIFIVVTTGGRSAYLAIIPVILVILWMTRGRPTDLICLAVIPVAVIMSFKLLSLPFYMPSTDGNQKIRYAIKESEQDLKSVPFSTFGRFSELSTSKHVPEYRTVASQLLSRGYNRVFDHPQYLLFGSGQGKEDRFRQLSGFTYEIHASLLAVLFYYGILGLLLFLLFIWRLFKHKKNLLFLAPLFVYGLFTYGLRSPYFWFALGFLALMPDLLNSKKDTLNESFE